MTNEHNRTIEKQKSGQTAANLETMPTRTQRKVARRTRQIGFLEENSKRERIFINLFISPASFANSCKNRGSSFLQFINLLSASLKTILWKKIKYLLCGGAPTHSSSSSTDYPCILLQRFAAEKCGTIRRRGEGERVQNLDLSSIYFPPKRGKSVDKTDIFFSTLNIFVLIREYFQRLLQPLISRYKWSASWNRFTTAVVNGGRFIQNSKFWFASFTIT